MKYLLWQVVIWPLLVGDSIINIPLCPISTLNASSESESQIIHSDLSRQAAVTVTNQSPSGSHMDIINNLSSLLFMCIVSHSCYASLTSRWCHRHPVLLVPAKRKPNAAAYTLFPSCFNTTACTAPADTGCEPDLIPTSVLDLAAALLSESREANPPTCERNCRRFPVKAFHSCFCCFECSLAPQRDLFFYEYEINLCHPDCLSVLPDCL